jgi:hypothetical protein
MSKFENVMIPAVFGTPVNVIGMSFLFVTPFHHEDYTDIISNLISKAYFILVLLGFTLSI